MQDNPKLKGVHSNQSIKMLLEKEATRALMAANGGGYQGPVIATHLEKGEKKADASNLPYLHKNPAI